MSRSRGRERRRLADELRADIAADREARADDLPTTDWHLEEQPAEELTTVRTLSAQDIGAVVSFRSAGRPGQRDMHLRTVGRLVGIRPATNGHPQSITSDAVDLVVQQGSTQASLRVALGEPITIRRTP